MSREFLSDFLLEVGNIGRKNNRQFVENSNVQFIDNVDIIDSSLVYYKTECWRF